MNTIYEVKDLGKLIRKKRKLLGYTQQYVSDFSGLSVSFISDVENGKNTVEFRKVIELTNILGLDILVSER